MASFYADENVPFPLVAALRALGHEILTALDDCVRIRVSAIWTFSIAPPRWVVRC